MVNLGAYRDPGPIEMVVAHFESKSVQTVSTDANSMMSSHSKMSKTIIDWLMMMIEKKLTETGNVRAILQASNQEGLFAYELACAWTTVIKRRISTEVEDYKALHVWVDQIRDDLIAAGLLSNAVIKNIHVQMKRFVLKYFAKLFGSALYSIIIDRSVHGVSSLTEMLEGYPELASVLLEIIWTSFSKDLEQKVLFIIKPTKEILVVVSESIKILLQIDRTGGFLEKFLKLTKNYLLAHRRAFLGQEVLALILRLSHMNIPHKSLVSFDVPDIDQRNFDSVMFGNIRGSTKTGDTYCILANFLDSSAEIVLEYKRHLIKKMHSNINGTLVIELRRELDIMRKMFAGDEWRECEVLIQDFEASVSLKAGPMELFRISSVYWPGFEPKSFFVPSNDLQVITDAIMVTAAENDDTKVYELTNSFSRVDLDLKFTNTTVSISCTADEASVLILLSQLKSAYFGELKRMTGFQFGRLKVALCMWVRKGIVLWQDHDRFVLIEEYHEHEDLIDCQANCWRLYTEEESEQNNHQTATDILKLIPLICGVLSNLGPMPLGILHTHLQKVSLGYQTAEYDLYLLLESHVTAGVLYVTAEGFYHVTNRI